jgi:hypothetical protein
MLKGENNTYRELEYMITALGGRDRWEWVFTQETMPPRLKEVKWREHSIRLKQLARAPLMHGLTSKHAALDAQFFFEQATENLRLSNRSNSPPSGICDCTEICDTHTHKTRPNNKSISGIAEPAAQGSDDIRCLPKREDRKS